MSIDPLLGGSDRQTPQGRGSARRATPPPPVIRPAGGRRGSGRLGIALGVVVAAAAVGVGVVVATGGDDATPPTTVAAVTTPPAPTTTLPSIDLVGSSWWLVNPQRPMPADYIPPDLVTPNTPMDPDVTNPQVRAETAAAFEAMVADAATAGLQLQLNSGYRSYEEQQVLYDRFVADYGAEVAAQRVALPGTSEHQTGLSLDVGQVGLPDDQVFGDTQASVWVADNAHRFGFILRYPPDKAHITGYTNEPWHLRYVGVELATQLHDSGLTMEEHFGLVPPETTASS
ncbi:M15 family metallopeptidase [Desertimonas flava]|uniref:M15 family metallopeptidase n=1 Tax=Desertimonas flava TaxID=2064846 RepID=UPI000E356E99|nr:M15 family metallopeptidase [Desertimonas flava]